MYQLNASKESFSLNHTDVPNIPVFLKNCPISNLKLSQAAISTRHYDKRDIVCSENFSRDKQHSLTESYLNHHDQPLLFMDSPYKKPILQV